MIKTKLTTITLVLTVLLSGCSVHRSAVKEPLVDMPSSYSTKGESPSPPIGKWWTRFEDDKLNQLMEQAFKYNLDIAQSYERLRQAQTAIRITNAERGLFVNVDASGGRARQPGMTGAVTADTYSLSAAAGFEIDLWGKLRSKAKAARLDALASEQNLKSMFISISAQLTDLYFLAAEQRAQLELSDQTIASFQDTLDRVNRRYSAGLVPAVDVYQARQNLASAKAQRPLFESRLTESLNAIAVLTGNFPRQEIDGYTDQLIAPPFFPAGLPSQLLISRPDIQAALFSLMASDKRIGAAIADRFPSFNLIGSYGGSSDEVKSVLDSPNIFWNILLQAAQPILDSGRRRAEVDRTEAVFRENLAVYHKTVLNAFREIEDALAGIRASEERIKMLNETVSASDNSLRLALDRYMNGLTDYLPVLTAQLSHFNTKSSLLAERRQLISDTVQLARALGGEWTDQVTSQYISHIKTEEKEK